MQCLIQIYVGWKGFEVEYGVTVSSTAVKLHGSFSVGLLEDIYYLDFAQFYNSLPPGSHVRFAEGTRAGIGRGLKIIALHRAYSLPLDQGDCAFDHATIDTVQNLIIALFAIQEAVA